MVAITCFSSFFDKCNYMLLFIITNIICFNMQNPGKTQHVKLKVVLLFQ